MKPWELGPGPKLPRNSGQHLGPLFKGLSVPGQLVDTAGHQPDHKSPGRVGRPCGTWDLRPRLPVQEVGPRALGPWPDEPG